MFRKDADAKNDAEERARLGFTAEDYADEDAAANDDITVQPDTLLPVSLFIDLMTQWRMAVSGPYALDYTAIPVVMELRGVAREERSELFSDLRIMESEALATMRRTK